MRNRLKEVRKQKGMSILELSKKAGITRTIIYRLENDPNDVTMRVDNAHRLAQALGCEIDDIFLP